MTEDSNRRTEAAEVILDTLSAEGVDYFLANGGTDFPSIIEAFARARAEGRTVPKPMVIPHENAAVSMAHGVYLMTGRVQAVMVHVNVGTANTINAVLDAARDRAPVLVMAGRTPITESGHRGSRTRFIHWAQEMFDQGGMLREAVKWDYELKVSSHAADVTARAVEMAMTEPRGPVYLTLPRDVLAGPAERPAGPPRRARPAPAAAGPRDVETLARWIAEAERPLVITSAAGRDEASFAALTRLADRWALPVVAFHQRYQPLPASHPMFQGAQPRPLLSDADLVVVLDCDVPWIPQLEAPPAACRVAHVGPDPSYAAYPMRSFPCDLTLSGDTALTLEALEAALTALPRDAVAEAAVTARHATLSARSETRRADLGKQAEAMATAPAISPEWLSHCIGKAVGEDAVIVNEYPLRSDHCPREKPLTFFGMSPAGGLGWGLGAALGIKLAAPEKLVVATLGDGAYMFANPTACHWIAEAHGLPVLTVVFNNTRYAAVRNAMLAMYGDGTAATGTDRELLADLSPSPAYETVVAASGGYGVRVDDPAALPAALAEAVRVVTQDRRQALVNVICDY